MIMYSATKGGFYDTTINTIIPKDAIEISSEQHAALLSCLNTGGSIEVDSGGAPQAVPAPLPTLADVQTSQCMHIDAAADQVYVAIGGPSPGRLAEYRQANDDATAYKAAGYSGTVPETVQCWATAQNWTAQQAADDILATAAAWESVLVAIRSARLGGKAAVSAATTIDAANTAAQTAIASIQQAGAAAS